MDFSTFALIIMGLLAISMIICTIVIYPELRDLVKELRRDF